MIIQDAQSNDLTLTISRSCQALEVSRSGYYEWLKSFEEPSSENGEYLDLINQIQEIASEFTCYGYRRITAELRNRGYVVNHKRVLKTMHQEKLLCHKRRFKPVTTDSTHGLPTYPNLLKNKEITGLNQVWASDITYVQLPHEHIYLAVVLDLYSRKCIGWDLSRSLKSDLAMNALAKALESRTAECFSNLIHHSDQGVQYASKDYVECLKRITSRSACREKEIRMTMHLLKVFIKTLKIEEVYLNEYETFEDALRNIWHFIEDVYNQKRLHSALGYKSPIQFEMEVALNTIA